MTTEKMTINETLYLYKEGDTNITALIVPATNCSPYSGQTIDEIQAENNNELTLLTWSQLEPKLENALSIKYPGEWKEITEDRYDEMLGCLPPEKWQTVDGVDIFRMSERQELNYTSHFAQYKGRYFSTIMQMGDNYTIIAETIKTL